MGELILQQTLQIKWVVVKGTKYCGRKWMIRFRCNGEEKYNIMHNKFTAVTEGRSLTTSLVCQTININYPPKKVSAF